MATRTPLLRPGHQLTYSGTPTRIEAGLLFPKFVIEAAKRDAIKGFYRGRPSEVSRDAMQFITSRSREVGSFEWAASWLHSDVPGFRRELLREIWAARLNRPAAMRRIRSHGRRVR